LKSFVGKFVYMFLAAVAFAVAGCSTVLPESQRIARYRPQVDVQPVIKPQFVSKTNKIETIDSAGVTMNNSNSIGVKPNAAPKPPSEIKQRGVAESVEVPVVKEREHNTLRSLKSGNRVIIHLRGIPHPEEINDVIDGWGEVTLPYIGEIKLIDKTVSEAERLIERSYIEGGIYKQINVIVVAEDEVYFVQGEVAKQGKYSLSGAVTLRQAISEAGGFTPFANRAKIKVMRGGQVLMYNGKDVAKGKIPDPPIFADDIIEVLRRWM
jgi:polysaccharide export outer membrane protein